MKKKVTVEVLEHILADPFYAITVHPIFCVPHQPMVDEETWIKANAVTIKDVGVEKFLRNLLQVLKGGEEK